VSFRGRVATTLAVAGLAAAAAAAALAGSTEAMVPGHGGAEIRWGELRFRKDLLDQLAPGLTWRIGSGAATRLELSGFALVGEKGILFPGEATLNLRYHSWEKWELVAFEENDWRWSADKHQLGLFPVEVWREKDPKKSAEKLVLTLRAKSGRERATRPADAVTPGSGDAPRPVLPPPVEYSKEAQAELDKAPVVDLEMRFGDVVALASFEAAKSGEAKGALADADGKKTPLRLRFAQFTAIRAKTELCESGTEVVVGALRVESKTAPEEWVVAVSGGAVPELWRRSADGAKTLPALEGRRVEVKSDRKATGAVFDKNVLTLQFHGVDYVFTL
jgi:hypothetical protein